MDLEQTLVLLGFKYSAMKIFLKKKEAKMAAARKITLKNQIKVLARASLDALNWMKVYHHHRQDGRWIMKR
jgi:hypothetical protein